MDPFVKDDATVRRLSYRQQRTLSRPVEVSGIGYLTGATVHLRFLPAPQCSGVVFVRTDLVPRVEVPALIDFVTGTKRRTTLGHPPEQIGLVEHVLAALAGLRIDNCRVELDAPEPPGLDGSSQRFVEALIDARDRLTNLRALFLGDIISEECLISWIKHSDLTGLLAAFPKLEHFRVRGGDAIMSTFAGIP